LIGVLYHTQKWLKQIRGESKTSAQERKHNLTKKKKQIIRYLPPMQTARIRTQGNNLWNQIRKICSIYMIIWCPENASRYPREVDVVCNKKLLALRF